MLSCCNVPYMFLIQPYSTFNMLCRSCNFFCQLFFSQYFSMICIVFPVFQQQQLQQLILVAVLLCIYTSYCLQKCFIESCFTESRQVGKSFSFVLSSKYMCRCQICKYHLKKFIQLNDPFYGQVSVIELESFVQAQNHVNVLMVSNEID